jgi:hypothetical protein
LFYNSDRPILAEHAEIHQETEHRESDPTDANEDSRYGDQNIEQPQANEDFGNHDQSEQSVHSDHEHAGHEQYEDELNGELDADADGETDYGSQLAPDAAEIHDNPDTDAPAPVGGASTEYEEVEEDKDDYDERFGEDIPSSKAGETVLIQGDLGDDHRDEWASDPADELHLPTDIASTEGSAVARGSEQANKCECNSNVAQVSHLTSYSDSGPIDLTGDADSEVALFEGQFTAISTLILY